MSNDKRYDSGLCDTLQSIGVDVQMSEIYAGVTFPPTPSDDDEMVEKPAEGK